MVDSSLRLFSADLAVVVSPTWLTSSLLWLHLATVTLFVLGIVLALRRPATQAQGVERLIPFGPTFFAVPLALFGLQHFVFLSEVKEVVPSWMPWHIFWACLVGVALIAACLSLITDIKAGLAGLLTGIMLFLFVLMLDLPGLIQNPHERLAMVGTLRDLSLSGPALALAGASLVVGRRPGWLVETGRWFFGVSIVYFGAQQFLHPEFAPGVPFPVPMPAWMPGHTVWAWAAGTALVAGGVCILARWHARTASAWVGVVFLVFVIFIYLPRDIVHPSIDISGELDDIAGTLAESGAALLLAGALQRRP